MDFELLMVKRKLQEMNGRLLFNSWMKNHQLWDLRIGFGAFWDLKELGMLLKCPVFNPANQTFHFFNPLSPSSSRFRFILLFHCHKHKTRQGHQKIWLSNIHTQKTNRPVTNVEKSSHLSSPRLKMLNRSGFTWWAGLGQQQDEAVSLCIRAGRHKNSTPLTGDGPSETQRK